MKTGSRPDSSRCRAFSLIELVVVIVLMAMLAAIASTSARGAMVRKRLSRSAEIVEQFDTELRRTARRDRRDVSGFIDRGKRRLDVRVPNARPRRFALPDDVSIDAIRTDTPGPNGTIVASPQGSTASYALKLSCGGIERWLYFAGATGQVVTDLDRNSVRALLESR